MARHAGWNQGDPVLGQSCPKCHRQTVVYNGNYFCTACPWTMSREVHRIIKAYLIQRFKAAELKGDQWEVDRMAGYLKRYAE